MKRVWRPGKHASLLLPLMMSMGCSGEVGPAGTPPEVTVPTPGVTAGNTSGVPGVAPGSSQVTPTDGVPTTPNTAAPGTSSTTPGNVTTSDPNAIPASPPPTELTATPRVARLSRQQWSNSVRRLLRLEDISEIDSKVSGDALIRFDTEADALFVTEQLRREMADAAEQLANVVVTDPAALARLEAADAPDDPDARARAFVTDFGRRAFRRPLTEAEISTHLALFEQGVTLYPDLDVFDAGANLVIQAMLQSPHFLYRTELEQGDASGQPIALNAYEVASKLAFALTNTMPDDELLAAAAAGFTSRDDIAAQASRLLEGPDGMEGVANFNAQVLRLGTYDGIRRDPAIFPDFTPETPAAMRHEVLQFLEWAFTEGHGVKDYYTSSVGFVNSDLASIYGVEGEFSKDTFTQVALDPTKRSGLLTQAGFLASYISGTQPDIIHRGVFIATRLLCLTLPPPDPNAGPLTEINPDMTNRERVEATTGKGTCGEGCHSNLLNPLGYGFENYDAIGKYRTTDKGKTVDAAATYTLDGSTHSFTNGVELSHLLAEAKQTHTCYTQNLLSYLHGRLITKEDAAFIDYYGRLSRADQISVRDLVLTIVTSDAFLTRLP